MTPLLFRANLKLIQFSFFGLFLTIDNLIMPVAIFFGVGCIESFLGETLPSILPFMRLNLDCLIGDIAFKVSVFIEVKLVESAHFGINLNEELVFLS